MDTKSDTKRFHLSSFCYVETPMQQGKVPAYVDIGWIQTHYKRSETKEAEGMVMDLWRRYSSQSRHGNGPLGQVQVPVKAWYWTSGAGTGDSHGMVMDIWGRFRCQSRHGN